MYTGCHRRKVVVNITVRMNDGADWVSVEGENNWTKDREMEDPIRERSMM